MPLTPVLGRQRQADLCEFKANLVHMVPGHPKLHRDLSWETNKKMALWL